jgi:hypothetical protein
MDVDGEVAWDETAFLERDPVLMKRVADDQKGLTTFITFTEEEWDEYNDGGYTRITWEQHKAHGRQI